MDILLDTNFIVTCTKQKIDFDEVAHKKIDDEITWVVPQEVLDEIKALSENKEQKVADRKAASLSLQILQHMYPKILFLNTKQPNVDKAIASYLNKNKKIILATLDKDLKKRVKNKILTIRGKKDLQLSR